MRKIFYKNHDFRYFAGRNSKLTKSRILLSQKFIFKCINMFCFMMLILFIYLKGCFRYIWAYNNVYAAVIIISCSLQNIYHTKLTSFYSQQDPALFLSLLLLSCTVLHIFSPEIIKANTIFLKKM